MVIDIDPHKASHTAVAIDEAADELSSVKVRATRRQVDKLLGWPERFEKRTWAIKPAGGVGYLLAQQLVARGRGGPRRAGTSASRIRVLATGRSNKNDPNDALSVAIARLSGSQPAQPRSGRPRRGPAPPGQAPHGPRESPHPGGLNEQIAPL